MSAVSVTHSLSGLSSLQVTEDVLLTGLGTTTWLTIQYTLYKAVEQRRNIELLIFQTKQHVEKITNNIFESTELELVAVGPINLTLIGNPSIFYLPKRAEAR